MAREIGVKSVRSLERGLLVLEMIQKEGSCSLGELHAQTQLSRATILRSLRTLEEQGWIARDDQSYRPGPKLEQRGKAGQSQRLANLAGPVLEALAKTAPWPADVAVLRGARMLIVRSSRQKAPFPIKADVIGRKPCLLRSALGRAYIAFCPVGERESLLAALRRSTDPDDRLALAPRWVDRMIAECREQGYAVREPGYYAGFDDEGPEVCSIAAPVLQGGHVIACMNLMWVVGTQSIPEFASQYLPHLRQAAQSLAARSPPHE